MTTLGWTLTAAIGLLHFYVLYLEMFRWDSAGPRVFGVAPAQVLATRPIAANLGLYNGFLGAGLCWAVALGLSQGAEGLPIAGFFLTCVAVAGLYAARRVRKTLWVQTLPALLALLCLWWGH